MSKMEQLPISSQLPSPNGVVLAVMEICRRDDATPDQMAKIVQSDQGPVGPLGRQARWPGPGGALRQRQVQPPPAYSSDFP